MLTSTLLTKVAEISTESKIVMSTKPTVYKCICIVCRGGIFLSKFYTNRMWLVNRQTSDMFLLAGSCMISSLSIMQHWCCTCIELMSKNVLHGGCMLDYIKIIMMNRVRFLVVLYIASLTWNCKLKIIG